MTNWVVSDERCYGGKFYSRKKVMEWLRWLLISEPLIPEFYIKSS